MTHQRSSDGYIGVSEQAAKGTAAAPSKFTRASGLMAGTFHRTY